MPAPSGGAKVALPTELPKEKSACADLLTADSDGSHLATLALNARNFSLQRFHTALLPWIIGLGLHKKTETHAKRADMCSALIDAIAA